MMCGGSTSCPRDQFVVLDLNRLCRAAILLLDFRADFVLTAVRPASTLYAAVAQYGCAPDASLPLQQNC